MLTNLETEVLNSLRHNVESMDIMGDGTKWGVVYLDNLSVSGKTRSGVLGSLDKKGLYKDSSTGFGLVLL